MPVSSIASASNFDTAVTKAALSSDTTGFGSLVSLRAPGVDTDRGLDLAIAQQVTRGDRVAVLVDEGLEQADAIRVVEQIDLVTAESLIPVERASFDSAGIVDDASAAGPAWFGRVAVGDITLSTAARECLTPVPAPNSFSGDTLVAMAGGSMLPIADIQLGDQVLAYDFDMGETVVREVTATLPHTDWLLEAHLSDGSVMSVTEDHRFWSVTDNGWVELQDLDTTDQLLTPDGATVTVDWLDWNAGTDAPAWDLTVAEEHNFFVAADESAQPVLVHNNTPGLFCGVPVDADLAEGLASLNRRLDDAGDAGSVGAALNKLAVDLVDDELDAKGVNRILNVILDVERRGDTDLAETMARNLAAEPRATESIVRRELALELSGSANAGVYSESVLGDSGYAAIWTMAAGRQDQVLVRIDDPDFWSFESDATNLAERRIRDYLVADGRSVDNFPLEPVPGRRDPDALVNGVKADFKSLSETGGENALYNNVRNSLQSPQGPNLVVDARTNAGGGVAREFARSEIERALDEATAVGLSRVDVILDDGTVLTWVQGTGFLP